MSFREKMHPQVSNAEIELFKALSLAGLTDGMVTQRPIILKLTVPDFQWSLKRKVVYLDGVQVHRKKQEYDEEIQNMLEVRGWQVLRVSYEAPLSAKRKKEILDEIAEFIGAEP